MTTITIPPAGQASENTSVAVSSTPTAASGPPDSRRIPIFVPRGQTYYWSPAWRASEGIALREIAEGNVRRFTTGADAAAWLLADDDSD